MKEWITGRNPVYEVFQASRRNLFRLLVAVGAEEKGRLAEILQLAAKNRLPVEKVPRQRLDALSDNHQGVAMEVSGYPYADLEDILDLAQKRQEAPFILILDLVQNPQNLGTLMRTAEAVGIHGILIPLARSATVTPAVVNASAGASEHLLVAQTNLAQAISHLKQENIWVIGLEGSLEARLPQDIRLDGSLALVVGNEGEGMRPLVRSSCDFLMRLPIVGRVDSLNAAVAGSVALYLALQARK
jgi:23S rRNA (guanosine2251-2'-O)-methyltransferase